MQNLNQFMARAALLWLLLLLVVVGLLCASGCTVKSTDGGRDYAQYDVYREDASDGCTYLVFVGCNCAIAIQHAADCSNPIHRQAPDAAK